jgi:hypothetical protein
MKRADARAAYGEFSKGTSEKVRQLAFAALGVVWLFRPDAGSVHLPRVLLFAATFAVGALALDLLQSIYGTVAWGVFHRRKEHEGLDDETDFKAPRQINWPTNWLFVGKIVALSASYSLLFRHLVALLW